MRLRRLSRDEGGSTNILYFVSQLSFEWGQSPWDIRAWIEVCKAKLAQLQFVSLYHCLKEANKLAD